jgi:HEAT repeat protein
MNTRKVITILFLLIFVSLYPLTLAAQTIPLDETIREDKGHRAQKRLKELGYDSGLIDGILGGKTKSAIKQFQREKRVPVTGILDQRTTNMLFASTSQSKVESSPKSYKPNGESVFAENSSLVEHALHLNSLAAWKAFVEKNDATKTEDTWHGLASFVPERVTVIPKAPDFACRAHQMMIGPARPAPVTPGQKVLLVTYSFTYGKPLWRVAFGSILFGSPQRPPVHFGLEIEIRVQALDMGKGTLVDFPSLSAKENTSKRDGAVKGLFKGLAKDLKGASPALMDMIGEAEMTIIQVGRVIDGEKGGIKDDLRRRIALSQISDPDWKMRQRGAEALSRVMEKEDVKVISDLLDDKNSWVSRALVREVNRGFAGKGRKSGNEMVPFFRSAMVSEDSWVRAEITKAIGKARIQETRSLILVAAKDKSGTVRRAAASTLGQLGQREGIETLVPMLDDADGQTAKAAAEALKRLGWKPPDTKMKVKYLLAAGKEDDIVALGAPAVPFLIESLQHASENTVATAIGSLGKMGEKRAVEVLISSLVGTNSRVRVRSAEALGNIGDRRATVPLMACLKERNSSLRSAAAEALGKIKDAKAVDALISVLEDKNKGTRLAAVKALGEIGDARAAEAVAKLLKDPNGKVKAAAAKALVVFNWQPDNPEAKVNAFMTAGNEKGIIGMGEGAVGPLTAMLADDSLQKRLDAIGLLGKIGSDAKGAIVPICGCLNARDEKEVIAAVKALAKIGDSAASPYIREALLTHTKVDRASIWMHFALACLNEERDEHIDALVKALSSERGSVAAQALGRIEFKDEELEIIASNLSSPDPKLRRQAAEIMGKVGIHDAAKHLWKRLSQEKDESVRKALRKAIRSLSKKQ